MERHCGARSRTSSMRAGSACRAASNNGCASQGRSPSARRSSFSTSLVRRSIRSRRQGSRSSLMSSRQAIRSPSSPTICNRRRASRSSRHSCIWASSSNMARPPTCSPPPCISAPRITLPAASAERMEENAMSEHIVRVYDEELGALKTMLAQMGGLAEDQLAKAIDSLAKRDTILADQVIAQDEKVDALELNIEEKA